MWSHPDDHSSESSLISTYRARSSFTRTIDVQAVTGETNEAESSYSSIKWAEYDISNAMKNYLTMQSS